MTVFRLIFWIKHSVRYVEHFLGGERRLFNLKICPAKSETVALSYALLSVSSPSEHVVAQFGAHS